MASANAAKSLNVPKRVKYNTSEAPEPVPSTSQDNSSGTQDLASLFECPVCFDYVLPPILQCQSGHLVCSNCRPRLTCCPTCRGPLGNETVTITLLYKKVIEI